MSAIIVRPAHDTDWDDLRTVLGTRGPAARCQCQRFKLHPGEAFAKFPAEVRADRLRESISGTPTGGLLARLGDEPAGWCAVEPRSAYGGLVRNNRVPWDGRTEDKQDASVWAVTCVFTRAGFRKRGVGRALVRAAVDYAREQGARALEGYPMVTKNALLEELHPGTYAMFEAAGFTEVTRPSVRRAVMRIDY